MALQDLDITERAIIKAYLVRVAALAIEFPDTLITIRDGESMSYMGSFDLITILHVFGWTEQTVVSVKIGAAAHTTQFIHGNFEDVVSNSSWTSDGEWLEDRLLKGVYA